MTVPAPNRKPRPSLAVPDLTPFDIDPIFLARINAKNIRPITFTVALIISVSVLSTLTAALESNFYRAAGSQPWWRDLGSFAVGKDRLVGSSMPMLSDYPSLLLAFTIVVSAVLVYLIFRDATKLHGEMERLQCVSFPSDDGRHRLFDEVEAVNTDFRRIGQRAPVALVAAFVLAVVANLLSSSRLFPFLPRVVAKRWWASLHPFEAGSIAWLLIGTMGIYFFYVQCVLGFKYVRFLHRRRFDYQFVPNIYNPDGFYGWATLRRLITSMQLGVGLTFLTSLALGYFVAGWPYPVVGIVVLVGFATLVFYVFIAVSLSFRRQVRHSKTERILELESDIRDAANASKDLPHALSFLVLHTELSLVQKVPSNPVRVAWLIAGAVTVGVPLFVAGVTLLAYLVPPT